ncbi:MAG: methyltransferase domain-containing protein [Kiritimatiellae bacterium]|nr:methyltransferase domain-containing protein [Kiritimatiellia bacterium]MDD5521723.1 methyltransferase domain-containing protein [Kiritimatiellia bacterium]
MTNKSTVDLMPHLRRSNIYNDHQPFLSRWTSHVALYARKKIFQRLMNVAKPEEKTKILDVGATAANDRDSNFFEIFYPFTAQITATGIEDARNLEFEFPGLTYIRTEGSQLPFGDRSFDLVVSFAVLEHVGNRNQQQNFLHELCRVGKACFLSTPNRWYPIEIHTLMPLLHWLPPKHFRAVLRLMGQTFYSEEKNLNLLSDKDVREMFPQSVKVSAHHFRLLGFYSNLVYYVKNLE